jgi:putative SOS response-associated peptidase YedK
VPAFDERLAVPRYNIAPTQPVVVVRQGATGRELVPMRWGLIPWWAKDPAKLPLMINARAETLAEKPAYRDPFKYRRCLIPASGFYEWQAPKSDEDKGKGKGKGPKQPYAALPADGGLIAFAGLWETWHSADGGEIDTAVIVTTDANRLLMPIHERMPVVLEPEDFETWLAPDTPPAKAAALLKPAREDLFALTPVSTRVNSADNDDPRLLERAEISDTPPPKEPAQGSLF